MRRLRTLKATKVQPTLVAVAMDAQSEFRMVLFAVPADDRRGHGHLPPALEIGAARVVRLMLCCSPEARACCLGAALSTECNHGARHQYEDEGQAEHPDF